jgi:hypothetical protein
VISGVFVLPPFSDKRYKGFASGMHPMVEKAAGIASSLARNKWFWTVLLVVVVAGASVMTVPYGLAYGLRVWFKGHGADDVVLRNLDFNPFTRMASLDQLTVLADGKTVLAVPQATLRFSWRPVWNREINIGQAQLRDAQIAIERLTADKWRIAGLETASVEETDAETPWTFRIAAVELVNSRVEYRSKEATGHLLVKTGQLDLSATPTAGFTVAGTVDAGDIRLEAGRKGMRLHIDAANLNYVWSSTAGTGAAVSGAIVASGIGADLAQNNVVLRTRADRLSLGGIAARGIGNIDVTRAQVVNITLSELTPKTTSRDVAKPNPLFAAGKVAIDEFGLADLKRYSFKSIELSRTYANLQRDKTGRWRLPALGVTTQDKRKVTDAARAATRIDRLRFDDTRLAVADLRHDTPVQTEIVLGTATMTGIDSADPAREATLSLAGTVGKYSPFTINGQLYPFTRPLELKMTAEFKAVDLPPLSPYVVDYAGYAVNAGHLDADLKVESMKGTLSGKTNLAFKDLKLEEKDADKAKQLATRLTMSLDAVASLLQDKEKRIRLSIDVSGNLRDPTFSFDDAIDQATSRAIRIASVSYLKWYFQPYGALITIAEAAGKTPEIMLDPITYEPGAEQPDEAAFQYISRIVELMKEKTRLTIKVCGKATPGDMALLESDAKRAQDLARRRSENVKDYLVTEGAIAAERVIVCAPELDSEPARPPRVELYL